MTAQRSGFTVYRHRQVRELLVEAREYEPGMWRLYGVRDGTTQTMEAKCFLDRYEPA